MWLRLVLELMQLIVPVEGAVSAAVREAHSNDPTGTKILNISSLAQRIVEAAAPIIEEVAK